MARLREATARFAGVLARADLAAEVPACPGWTVADLAEHLRSVHLWAAHAVTEGTPDGVPAPGMLDRPSLAAGYRAAAGHLVDVLAATPPDAPVWAFGPKPRVAQFWRRRQVHETNIHLYDALAAWGFADDWSLEPALARDGVEEVATIFYPRQLRLERTAALPGTLRLMTTDTEGDPIELGGGEPVTEVHDEAERLLLMLWGRLPMPAQAAALLDGTAITP